MKIFKYSELSNYFSILVALGILSAPAALASPLGLAVSSCDTATVSALLANGADPNQLESSRIYKGRTPLCIAVRNVCADADKIVDLLFAAGADATFVTPDGYGPLMGAASQGNEYAFFKLIEHGANPLVSNGRWTVLNEAVPYSSIKVVKFLLDEGLDPNNDPEKSGLTPFVESIRYGRGDLALLMIPFGANINKALPGSSPNKYELLPVFSLFEVCASGDYNNRCTNAFALTQALIGAGANILFATYSPLFNGCDLASGQYQRSKCKETFELFLSSNADLNTQDAYGLSPLMYAVKRANIDEAQKLVDAGANKKLKNNEGKTAYDLAIQLGYLEVAKVTKP